MLVEYGVETVMMMKWWSGVEKAISRTEATPLTEGAISEKRAVKPKTVDACQRCLAVKKRCMSDNPTRAMPRSFCSWSVGRAIIDAK